MAKINRVELKGGMATIQFFCPGCEQVHAVRVPGWSFNGSETAPTFHPSVLVTSGHFAPHFTAGSECWCTYRREHPDEPVSFRCYRCHSFVREGKIQFLTDSTHELAGQTVELPEWRPE